MRHLDADTAIAYLNGVREIDIKLTTYYPRIAISSIVLAELIFGARKSSRVPENLKRIKQFTDLVTVEDFDINCAETYGDLRASLESAGKKVPSLDLLIASVAIANHATLVTHNTRHYAPIGNLQLEDWIS